MVLVILVTRHLYRLHGFRVSNSHFCYTFDRGNMAIAIQSGFGVRVFCASALHVGGLHDKIYFSHATIYKSNFATFCKVNQKLYLTRSSFIPSTFDFPRSVIHPMCINVMPIHLLHLIDQTFWGVFTFRLRRWNLHKTEKAYLNWKISMRINGISLYHFNFNLIIYINLIITT